MRTCGILRCDGVLAVVAPFVACAAFADIAIDAAFPGGNVKVVGIDQRAGVVKVAPDLRDTAGDWFWFNFRVRGAEGRTMRFEFPKDTSLCYYLGPLGPAVSRDGGRSWAFLNEKGHGDGLAFSYAFGPDDREVRFAHGLPYGEREWAELTASVRANPRVRIGALCKSQSGLRDVDLLTIEPEDGKSADWLFAFTARHHCCEVSANPVMEGLVQAALADDETGRWVREHVKFVFIPFMDKDGVVCGDQGKNRRPWDYNRDYTKDLYSSVRAFKALLAKECSDKKLYYIDLHSPWIRGNEHDHFFSLGPDCAARPELDLRWKAYSRRLTALTKGTRLVHDPKWDIPGGIGYNQPKNLGGTEFYSSTRWCVNLPYLYCGFCMEYGYGLCGGVNSREASQELGRMTLRAIVSSIGKDDAE